MVMLVWYILSLFGVCEFSWLAVLFDSLIVMVYFMSQSTRSGDINASLCMGVCAFAAMKQFLALTISPWWILLSPLAFIILFFFPGGFTLSNLLLAKYNLITLPTWGFVVGIIMDVATLIALIVIIVDSIRNKG